MTNYSVEDIRSYQEMGIINEETAAELIEKLTQGKNNSTSEKCSATYKFIPEHNGIELYFDIKPSNEIREELKRNGWKWHVTKECWFVKKSPAAEALAKKLCTSPPLAPQQSAPPQPQNSLPTSSNCVSVTQHVGTENISTLTITPINQGYQINSTNNQIICCDCNRFFSVHTQACPFCGCPTHFVADTYYKRYNADAVKEQQRKQQEEAERQKKNQEYKHDMVWDCYYKSKPRRNLNYFLQLECLDIATFNRVIERVRYTQNNHIAFQSLSDEEWYSLITSSDMVYTNKTAKLIKDHADETDRQEILKKAKDAQEKIRQLKINALCKKHCVSESTRMFFVTQYNSATDVQAQLETADYYCEKYPHIFPNREDLTDRSVESMKRKIEKRLRQKGIL